MQSNQRSKRKSKGIEPITFDELRDAAGMSGFVSFLNLPTADAVTTPADIAPADIAPVDIDPADVGFGSGTAPVKSTPDEIITAPVAMSPVNMVASVIVPVAGVSGANAPEATPVDMAGVGAAPVDILQPFSIASAGAVRIGGGQTTPVDMMEVDIASVHTTPVVLPRPGTDQVLYAPVKGGKNLYRCSTVQDGHSHLEEALYQLLWRTGTVRSDDLRIAQVSQSDLARHLRITDKNLRIALDRLVEKRSIEVAAAPDFALKMARQYQVYSGRAILERRRDAGMEWVIRNKGVQFVSGQDVERYRVAGTIPVVMAGD